MTILLHSWPLMLYSPLRAWFPVFGLAPASHGVVL